MFDTICMPFERLMSLQLHVVHFDQQRKIDQIRLHWDQAALLKDVEVIGARGKNWPIKPGKDQARLVASEIKASLGSESPRSVSRAESSGDMPEPNGERRKNASKDPHASLALFAADDYEKPDTPRPNPSSTRSSGKPPPRHYNELFGGGGGSDTPRSSVSRGTSFAGGPQSAEKPSPKKVSTARNFHSSRLFGESESNQAGSDERIPRPNPKKFDHFDLGEGGRNENDGNSQAPSSPSKHKSKHLSQWDFDDSAAPQKPPHRVRGQDVRHFGWSDDEVAETPAQTKRGGQARRDVATHFEFKDSSTPQAERKRPAPRTKGTLQANGHSLYENNLYDDSPSSPVKMKLPPGNVTNINNHRKNFDSHFSMADESPKSGAERTTRNNDLRRKKKVLAQDHQEAVRNMGSNWDRYDEYTSDDEIAPRERKNKEIKPLSSERTEARENARQGSKKDDNDGDDGDNGDSNTRQQQKRSNIPMHSARPAVHRAAGRSNLERHWGFGGSDEEDTRDADYSSRNQTGHQQHGRQQSRSTTASSTSKGFWDFE